MTAEPDYDAEMRLPDGKTCADCHHIARCTGFGFTSPKRTSCDFWPNRFADGPKGQDQPDESATV